MKPISFIHQEYEAFLVCDLLEDDSKTETADHGDQSLKSTDGEIKDEAYSVIDEPSVHGAEMERALADASFPPGCTFTRQYDGNHFPMHGDFPHRLEKLRQFFICKFSILTFNLPILLTICDMVHSGHDNSINENKI